MIDSKAGSKDEVERILWGYREYAIEPRVSEWGDWYELEEGERMVRYEILGREPIDIVYDGEGRVVAVFASYE